MASQRGGDVTLTTRRTMIIGSVDPGKPISQSQAGALVLASALIDERHWERAVALSVR